MIDKMFFSFSVT